MLDWLQRPRSRWKRDGPPKHSLSLSLPDPHGLLGVDSWGSSLSKAGLVLNVYILICPQNKEGHISSLLQHFYTFGVGLILSGTWTLTKSRLLGDVLGVVRDGQTQV